VRRTFSARVRNLGGNSGTVLFIDVQNPYRGAIRGKLERDCPAYTAAATSNDRSLAVKSKLARYRPLGCQSETPRFQGMKSSWFFSSALVRTSPLATWIT
jgi:hypothetical protein